MPRAEEVHLLGPLNAVGTDEDIGATGAGYAIPTAVARYRRVVVPGDQA